MKNFLIYVHPRKNFDTETTALARVQIDNSYRMGWKADDIFLVTNFPYEYNGVRALEVPDSTHSPVKNHTSKIDVILYLFEHGLLDGFYWFHDFDAFQLHWITEQELGLGGFDIGCTDYGWSPKWNTGSFFFKPESSDIFQRIWDLTRELWTDEERAMVKLTEDDKSISNRIKRMNITYNLGMRKIDYNLSIADKPLRVVHFHPGKRDLIKQFKPIIGNLMEVFDHHGCY